MFSLRRFLVTNPTTRTMITRLSSARAHDMCGQVLPHIPPRSTVLDVGTGIGDVAALIAIAGHTVTALDVEDLTCVPDVTPVVYDGTTMPFTDKSFDVALILTVLHHTPNPEQVLREAARVAKRVVIIEDVFHSTPHKYATFGMDSLLNLEFFNHPHSNKSNANWHKTFDRLGLQVITEQSSRSFVVMRHKLYVLESS